MMLPAGHTPGQVTHSVSGPARGTANLWTMGAVLTAIFCCATAVLHVFAQSSEGWKESPIADAEASAHLGGIAGFVAIAFVVAAAAFVDSDPDALALAVLPLCVALWEIVSHYLIGFQMSIVWISANSGLLVYPQQYLLWAFSMPSFFLMLHQRAIAQATLAWTDLAKLAASTMFAWCMLVCGAVAAVQPPAMMLPAFSLGCVFLAGAAYFEAGLLGLITDGSQGVPGAIKSILRLRRLFSWGCLIFPVVFLLRVCHVVDPVTGSVLMIGTDTAVKCCFAVAAGRGLLSSDAARRHEALAKSSSKALLDFDSHQKAVDLSFAEMTHELRTPLNGIIGILENLFHTRGHELSDHTKSSLTTVLTTAKRFSKLVGSALDRCSLGHGRLTLYRKPVLVSTIVEEVTPLITPLLGPKTVLSVKLPELPAISADHERIVQVLMNLLGNAVKFTSQGTITISGKEDGDFVNISVSDTGKGIPAHLTEKMFQAFEQSADATSSKHGSTGLGLSVAKSLVEAHGGELLCQSVVGKGSTFTARIPKSDEAPVETISSKQVGLRQRRSSRPENITLSGLHTLHGESGPTYLGADSTELDGRGMELLSVDDDPVNQVVIGDILGSIGFTIIKAMDAAQALDILAERAEQDDEKAFPDIILMDQMMPKMTGVECTRIIRERYPHVNVPIVMVSANDDEDSVVQGLQNGCNDYVTKPIKRMELMARIGLQLRVVEYFRREAVARQHEQILSGILPDNIICRLQAGQTQIADALKEVTILFSDIVGFTELTASVGTIEIIKMLDGLFSRFDAMVDRHKVYKVETIGDAYMIVAGHDSTTESDHAARMTRVAVEMIEIASGLLTPAGKPLRIRVGMHSGPAYAGVVGHKCPRYCFFGDTVNTASRMESNGYPMTVHMSSSTYTLATSQSKEPMDFCDMGTYDIKGKGQMRTWLLKYGEHEEALALHKEKLIELAGSKSTEQQQQQARIHSGQLALPADSAGAGSEDVRARFDKVDQRLDKVLEYMQRNSAMGCPSGSSSVTFSEVVEQPPDTHSLGFGAPVVKAEEPRHRSSASDVLSELSTKVETLSGAVAKVSKEVKRQSLEISRAHSGPVEGGSMGIGAEKTEVNSSWKTLSGTSFAGSDWDASSQDSEGGSRPKTQKKRLPRRTRSTRVEFQANESTGSLADDAQLSVADAARKSLRDARKSLDGHRVRMLAQHDKSVSQPGSTAADDDSEDPSAAISRVVGKRNSRGDEAGAYRGVMNESARGGPSRSRSSKFSSPDPNADGDATATLASGGHRRNSSPYTLTVPDNQLEDSGIVAVLTDAGLKHYASTLVLNNATPDELRGLAPEELSQFGIFTTRAQQRVHEALKAWDAM